MKPLKAIALVALIGVAAADVSYGSSSKNVADVIKENEKIIRSHHEFADRMDRQLAGARAAYETALKKLETDEEEAHLYFEASRAVVNFYVEMEDANWPAPGLDPVMTPLGVAQDFNAATAAELFRRGMMKLRERDQIQLDIFNNTYLKNINELDRKIKAFRERLREFEKETDRMRPVTKARTARGSSASNAGPVSGDKAVVQNEESVSATADHRAEQIRESQEAAERDAEQAKSVTSAEKPEAAAVKQPEAPAGPAKAPEKKEAPQGQKNPKAQAPEPEAPAVEMKPLGSADKQAKRTPATESRGKAGATAKAPSGAKKDSDKQTGKNETGVGNEPGGGGGGSGGETSEPRGGRHERVDADPDR